jgi:hypothetical protein
MKLLEFWEFLAQLKQTPVRLAQIIGGIPEALVHEKPSPDEFSATEHICHLRDIESEGYSERFQRILQEDLPTLADIDGGRLAFERNYNHQNLREALNAFSETRSKNLKLLKAQNLDQLKRVGELQGVGRVTIRDLILMLREHDEAHLDELEALKNQLYRRSQ